MKLDVRVLVPGLPFDPADPFAKGLGGSETAGLQVAAEIAAMGHVTTLYGNVPGPGRWRDVTLFPHDGFNDVLRGVPCDLAIVQRAPLAFAAPNSAKVRLLWVHDLMFARRRQELVGALHQIDRIVTVSDWQKRQYQDVVGDLPDSLFTVSRNGIDLGLVDEVAKSPPKRDPNLIVCAARPERGVDVLLMQLFPALVERNPKLRLAICSYDCPNPALEVFYANFEAAARQMGERVEWHGSLAKRDLYHLLHRASAYVYPVPSPGDPSFSDTSCVVGETLVDMPRDYRLHPDGVPIADLVGRSRFPVYCYDAVKDRMTLGTVKWVAKTKVDAEVWKLTLDDGSTVRATPEHRIMRRDGTWVELRDLLPGDALMPLYKHHRVVVNRNNGQWVDEARLVGEWIEGRELDGHNEHVHHRDGWWSNEPSNLQVMSRSEHQSMTHKGKRNPPLAVIRQKASLQAFLAGLTPEESEVFFALRPKAAKALWKKINGLPPEERAEWLRARTAKNSQHRSAEVRENMRPNGARFAKVLWDRVNAMSPAERESWLTARTEAMREARWNHSVVSVGPDGRADVYDMEVETHHNFVAGGIVVHNCIAVMEAMACGCVPVTSDRGALPETIGDAGVLIPMGDAPHAATEAMIGAFVEQTTRLLADPLHWGRLRAKGMAKAEKLGWKPVAEQMIDTALGLMADDCADPVRLARHFIRRQDIEAAQRVLMTAREPDDPAKRAELVEIHDWFEARYAHTQSPERLTAYYADTVGPGNTHVFEGLMQAPAERFTTQPFVRFQLIEERIRARLGQPDDARVGMRILDFGCSQGECPIVLSNRLDAYVLGVDASPSEMERARRLADAKAKDPALLSFAVATETDLSAIEDDFDRNGPFDALVMAEVLEHLIDPVALLQKLEAMVRTGGSVVLTVPYGPWETQQPEPARGQHLREWYGQELNDLFGAKRRLIIDKVPLMSCPVTNEVLGNTIVAYDADREPLGEIDWAVKLAVQRPRQTLSASMIVGGKDSHETLHWCLGSVRDVADEIVIADCGMTDEARRIADQYGPRYIDARDTPPTPHGFEVPRNISLEACRGDWVMMIDGDERLYSGANLTRYLRPNIYQTYAVPQHHFAVDSHWPPDLPGRVWRRLGTDVQGRTMRIVGQLHEHPEFGPNLGCGRAVRLGDVNIAHVGYMEQSIRAARYQRNFPMLHRDLAKYPDRKLGLLILCRDTMIQAMYITTMDRVDHRQPGCALRNQHVAKLCHDVIGVVDRVFLDSTDPMMTEVMQHYHNACRMLGTDVVAQGQLQVTRQGIVPPSGPTGSMEPVHFFNLDHYNRYLRARLKVDVGGARRARILNRQY